MLWWLSSTTYHSCIPDTSTKYKKYSSAYMHYIYCAFVVIIELQNKNHNNIDATVTTLHFSIAKLTLIK